MTTNSCNREREIWTELASGRWPATAAQELRAHAAECPSCQDVIAVAMPLLDDERQLRRHAAPPSAAVVWFRAQLRARQEAAVAASRPMTIVHALAIACGLGVLAGLAGFALAWLRSGGDWVGVLAERISLNPRDLLVLDVTGHWLALPLLAIGLWVLFAPVAVYLIIFEGADD